MSNRMKVPFISPDGGITQETGTLVNVVKTHEPWSEYDLEDGTKLRMKQTVINVVRLDDRDDDGNPMYSIQSQQTLSVIPRVEE
jgi:hypothetical protein